MSDISIVETGDESIYLTPSNPTFLDTGNFITLTRPTQIYSFTAFQYSGVHVWALDATNAQLFLNGQTFQGYDVTPGNGQYGFTSEVTLPAGTWYMGVWDSNSIPNGVSVPVFYEMSALQAPAGLRPVGDVDMAVGGDPGSWKAQRFHVTGNPQEFVEAESSGGEYVIMSDSQFQTFQSEFPNGYTGGTFYYTTFANGFGTANAEIEGNVVLPAGHWNLVWINNSGSWAGGAANIEGFASGTSSIGSAPPPPPLQNIHFDIFLGGKGYGSIEVTDNGVALPCGKSGESSAEIAYDNLLPIPVDNYDLQYPYPPGGHKILFLNTTWASFVEIHGGNNPGENSNGCIVVADNFVNNIFNDGFWTGLKAQLDQMVQNGSLASITATVLGNTEQPTLTTVPGQTTITQGQTDNVTFAIQNSAGPVVPLDKVIKIFFTVTSSTGSSDFEVIGPNGNVLTPLTTGPHAGDYKVKIVGDLSQNPTGNGASQVSISIVTNGTTSEDLTVTIQHYTGVRYPYAGGSVADYDPSKQPMLDGTQPADITVNVPAAATVAPEVATIGHIPLQHFEAA